nr:acyltransferase family protein [Schleiferilactobacillus harbinensis]
MNQTEAPAQINSAAAPVKKARIAWVDIAKAIGILAVVLGHAYPHKDALYEVTYWWHMPLFFFIGGFFLKPLPPHLASRSPLLSAKSLAPVSGLLSRRGNHHYHQLLYGASDCRLFTGLLPPAALWWHRPEWLHQRLLVRDGLLIGPNRRGGAD